jgi:WD40 repeat protein
VWSVAFGESAGAAVGLSASHDASVKVWPLSGGVGSLASLPHPDWVCSVSADGETVATGCGDGRLRLWSLGSHKCVRVLDHCAADQYFASDGSNTRVRVGNRSPVFSVRLIGGAVLSGGQDQHVRVWSLNGECVAALGHGANVRGLAGTAAGGGFVASVGGKGANGKKLCIVWRAPPPPLAAAAAPPPAPPTRRNSIDKGKSWLSGR